MGLLSTIVFTANDGNLTLFQKQSISHYHIYLQYISVDFDIKSIINLKWKAKDQSQIPSKSKSWIPFWGLKIKLMRSTKLLSFTTSMRAVNKMRSIWTISGLSGKLYLTKISKFKFKRKSMTRPSSIDTIFLHNSVYPATSIKKCLISKEEKERLSMISPSTRRKSRSLLSRSTVKRL